MSAQSALLQHVGQQTLHARVRTCCTFQVAHRSKRLTYKPLRHRDRAGCSKRSVKAAAEPVGTVVVLPMFALEEFAGTICWHYFLAVSCSRHERRQKAGCIQY